MNTPGTEALFLCTRTPVDAALSWANYGQRVFPVSPDKIPCIKWKKGATTDPKIIRRLWRKFPSAGVGVVTGDGLAVLDVDNHGGVDGGQNLRTLKQELDALPVTLSASTPSGGRHLYFTVPPEARIKNSAGQLGAGLDVRGDGGMILVPCGLPGRAWDAACGPMMDLPAAWVARLTPPARPAASPAARLPVPSNGKDRTAYGASALAGELGAVASAVEGTRNARLNTAACKLGGLVAAGALQRANVETALLGAATAAGLPEEEARKTIQSGMTAGMATPREIPAPGKATAKISAAAGNVEALDNLPCILLGVDEARVIDDAIVALSRDTTLFTRGRALVTIAREEKPSGAIDRQGGSFIFPIPQPNLRERLCRVARFESVHGQGGEWVRKPNHPPAFLIPALHVRGEWTGLRPLVSLIVHPVLLPNGQVLDTPGYEATHGLFLAGGGISKVPDKPSADDVRAALATLQDVVCDFPFAGGEHQAAWLAALLTVFARPAIDGPCPLFLIDKNVRGAGGSLLADTIGIAALGRSLPRMSETGDDEESRKRITSILLAGDEAVLIDNLTRPLGNGPLDAVLTATTWRERILGKSEMTSELPALTVWFATGNNIEIHGDLVRRILPIRLDSLEEAPETRVNFKHPDLRGFIRAQRNTLMSAALTILRAFAAAGHPSQGLRAWGSFESWCSVVRNCLVWVGLPDCTQTRVEYDELGDREKGGLADLFEALFLAFPSGHGISAARVVEQAKNNAALSEALDALGVADSHGNYSTRLLGWQLRHARGRIVGGKRLEPERTTHKHAHTWWLERCGSCGCCGSFIPIAEQEKVFREGVKRTATTAETPSDVELDALEAAEERAAIVEADEVQP